MGLPIRRDTGPFTPGGSAVSADSGSRAPYTPANMRPSTAALLGILLACLCLGVLACEQSQKHYGCKISGGACMCRYGCKTEYIFKTRQACSNVLKERSSNACQLEPCRRGICTQTSLGAGFSCKCDGTGYYGHLCEKACPTARVPGLVFPHECVVI